MWNLRIGGLSGTGLPLAMEAWSPGWDSFPTQKCDQLKEVVADQLGLGLRSSGFVFTLLDCVPKEQSFSFLECGGQALSAPSFLSCSRWSTDLFIL